MKYVLIFFAIILILSHANTLRRSDASAAEPEPAVASHAYPIAPGVWSPGDPLPEKPVRYYRVRCFPGCHSGSSYGMYPDEPLNMKPIFPTSPIDNCPLLRTEKQ